MIDFDFQIRKSPARKTLSIRIYPDNRVVVAAPQRLSQKEIMRFVEEKTGWIHKTMKSNLEKAKTGGYGGSLPEKNFSISGRNIPLKSNRFMRPALCPLAARAAGKQAAAAPVTLENGSIESAPRRTATRRAPGKW